MKSKALNLLLIAGSILLPILFVEMLMNLTSEYFLKKGRLFKYDALTGWVPLGNRTVTRINSNGDYWKVKTDSNGLRISNSLPQNVKISKNKLLILGDSFAFGEGVDIENRFDSVLASNYNIVNIGVMGYGTDQQYLRAISYLKQLKKGDIVFLLTYLNDFSDIQKKSHSGRSKPIYTASGNELTLQLPSGGLLQILRDKSWIISRLGLIYESTINGSPYSDTIINDSSVFIFRSLVDRISRNAQKRQASLIIAFHGFSEIKPQERALLSSVLSHTCSLKTVTECINIDDHFTKETHPSFFLSDGHWSNDGNAEVGRIISEKLIDDPIFIK